MNVRGAVVLVESATSFGVSLEAMAGRRVVVDNGVRRAVVGVVAADEGREEVSRDEVVVLEVELDVVVDFIVVGLAEAFDAAREVTLFMVRVEVVGRVAVVDERVAVTGRAAVGRVDVVELLVVETEAGRELAVDVGRVANEDGVLGVVREAEVDIVRDDVPDLADREVLVAGEAVLVVVDLTAPPGVTRVVVRVEVAPALAVEAVAVVFVAVGRERGVAVVVRGVGFTGAFFDEEGGAISDIISSSRNV